MPNRFQRHRHHRAYGRAGARGIDRTRQRIGSHIPRRVYHELILELLSRAPQHELPSRLVRRTIADRLARHFTPTDLALRGRTPLWVNEMQWTKKRMVMDGLLEPVLLAGHSTWRLTRGGVRQAQGSDN